MTLSLSNISKDFTLYNVKKPGSNGYVYNFSVDYNSIAVSDIVDLHKYLMQKHNIKWCSNLLNQVFLRCYVLAVH